MTIEFRPLPASAAWRHQESREGFESVFFRADGSGYRFDGHTAAVEDGEAWAVHYTITVGEQWSTRAARIWGWSVTGEHERGLATDGSGHWEVDGSPVPELHGCLHIDLEASSFTNTLFVRRSKLAVGQSLEAPAAWVRAGDLRVERLEQHYMRLDDDGTHQRYEYRAPAFGFECQIVFDEAGLVVDYPDIATRVQ